jgi:hypothetical protein
MVLVMGFVTSCHARCTRCMVDIENDVDLFGKRNGKSGSEGMLYVCRYVCM